MTALTPATPADVGAIDAFLAPLSETSMFLRSNLRSHGLGPSGAATSMRVWLDRPAGGAIRGLVGLTRGGMLLPQLPAAGREEMARAAATLAGLAVAGVAGETAQVHALVAGATLRCAAFEADETLHSLDLAGLVVPAGAGSARPATPADVTLVADWRRAYVRETLGFGTAEAAVVGDSEARALCSSGDCCLLEVDGTPVAMTALNATMPEVVQVGGVYTPPAQRGRGFARRVVALHLAGLRRQGVERAVLFARNPAALRAYAALGFRPVGGYSVVLYRQPQRMESVA